MSKRAHTGTPIHDLLATRWSPRAFAERPVEEEKLLALFEAARWAPSSRNEQPWSFIVGTKEAPTEFSRLLNCLTDGNIEWAKDAPVLIYSVAKMRFDYKNRPNRHAYHDVALAVMSLVVQAPDLGLYAHQMAGFHRDKVREEFDIPETHEPVTAVAVGYLGDPGQLPERMRKDELAARYRKPLTDFVFSGAWGQVAPLVAERQETAR